MTSMLTIPQMPYDYGTVLYATFETKKIEWATITSSLVTRIFEDAYSRTVAELVGHNFLSLAIVSPDIEQGLFSEEDQIQYRMAIKCPDKEFGALLDVNIRLGLVASNVDNDRIFSACVPFNARDTTSFFKEDWNGFLQGAPYCRTCHRKHNETSALAS